MALQDASDRQVTRALNQQPSRGIRILKELAEFAPQKPVDCVERVVQFALELLKRPAALQGLYTPFSILEGAIRTDMEEHSFSQQTLTITRYRLDLELASAVRGRVIDAILSSLRDGPPRRAFLAADLLAEALRSPMHDGEDITFWDNAHRPPAKPRRPASVVAHAGSLRLLQRDASVLVVENALASAVQAAAGRGG